MRGIGRLAIDRYGAHHPSHWQLLASLLRLHRPSPVYGTEGGHGGSATIVQDKSLKGCPSDLRCRQWAI
jgi:hypothetical protein